MELKGGLNNIKDFDDAPGHRENSESDDESRGDSLYEQFDLGGWTIQEVRECNRIAPKGQRLQDMVEDEDGFLQVQAVNSPLLEDAQGRRAAILSTEVTQTTQAPSDGDIGYGKPHKRRRRPSSEERAKRRSMAVKEASRAERKGTKKRSQRPLKKLNEPTSGHESGLAVQSAIDPSLKEEQYTQRDHISTNVIDSETMRSLDILKNQTDHILEASEHMEIAGKEEKAYSRNGDAIQGIGNVQAPWRDKKKAELRSVSDYVHQEAALLGPKKSKKPDSNGQLISTKKGALSKTKHFRGIKVDSPFLQPMMQQA
ncbi:MAG: hypothetical protein Q9163_003861 [Psora crenata]